MSLDLPASVVARVEFTPVEDVALYILRHNFDDIPIYSLIPESPPVGPFATVRRDTSFGDWQGDERFLDYGRVIVEVFTIEPDSDEKGALISEAIRTAMRDAWMTNLHIPDAGWVSRIKMTSEPQRRPNWATSQGSVQMADLPGNYTRYETKYALRIRKPTT